MLISTKPSWAITPLLIAWTTFLLFTSIAKCQDPARQGKQLGIRLLSLNELDEAGVSLGGHATWTPDGRKVWVHGDQGSRRSRPDRYLKRTFVVDVRSKRYVTYSDKDQTESGTIAQLQHGTFINVATAGKWGWNSLTNDGFLSVFSLKYNHTGILSRSFGLEEKRTIRGMRSQSCRGMKRRGTNVLMVLHGDSSKGVPREVILFSDTDGKLRIVEQKYNPRDAKDFNDTSLTPANFKPLVAAYHRERRDINFMPSSLAAKTIQLDDGVRVLDLVFCNHDQWICCLTTRNDKSFSLKFFDVATGQMIQEIETQADFVSTKWRTLQANIEGTTLFVPEDKLLLDWTGDRFEKIADIGTAGIAEVFRDQHVTACAMDPLAKNVVFRLRAKESDADDLWLLSTEAFRNARRKIENELQTSKVAPSEKSLADRVPQEIPFDDKRPYHPKDLLLWWDTSEYSSSAAEKLALVGGDRWVVAQFERRTCLYDLWLDRQYNLNSLAWDRNKIGSIRSGKVSVPSSMHFSSPQGSNELVMAGERDIWLWDLSGNSPRLIQHATTPKRPSNLRRNAIR